MYEIWASQGPGGVLVVTTTTLSRALRYCIEHYGEASFAIKYPTGEWHRWGENE
jgi:hypothetical protein